MRPPITLLATTYFPPGEPGAIRRAAFQRAMDSWKRHLVYSGELLLHMADDGSPFDEVLAVCPFTHRYSRQERRGVGASLNAGFGAGFEVSPLVLYVVDDWELMADLDLNRWADLLLEREDIGMVRLGPPHPNIRGTIAIHDNETDQGAWFLRLDPYAFAFGHRPALYHQRFIEAFGMFAEGVNAYDCERIYAEHYCETRLDWLAGGKPPPDVVLALPTPWRHIESIELGDVTP